jgi:hypothetical protein
MTVEQRDLTPEQSSSSTRKLPKRDYVLLPLLSLVTILVLCGTTVRIYSVIPISATSVRDAWTFLHFLPRTAPHH